MQNKARVCLACSPVVNSYRTDQRVSLLPETDAASTNPTLIFHVLSLDFLIFGGADEGGPFSLLTFLLFCAFFFCPTLRTRFVTNCVLNPPRTPHPVLALLTFSAVMFPPAPSTHSLYFCVLFSLLLKQTTSGQKDGPCDLMDHFIYLCFPRGDDTPLTGCWSDARLAAPLSVLHVFVTIVSEHNMHFVSRKWWWRLSD